MRFVPEGITTCLFDLDGVLTEAAKMHAHAWKEMFDEFLRDWANRTGEPFEEFDRPTDYDEYVDGKPRLDGVHSFLRSRGIELPMARPPTRRRPRRCTGSARGRTTWCWS